MHPSLTTRRLSRVALSRGALLVLAVAFLPRTPGQLQLTVERATRVRPGTVRSAAGGAPRLGRAASNRAHVELPAPSDLPIDAIAAAPAAPSSLPASPWLATATPSAGHHPAGIARLPHVATPSARWRRVASLTGRGPPRI